MHVRHYFAHYARLVFASIIVLWFVDVVLNLGLWQATLLGSFVYGTTTDYLGLLVVHTQLAGILVILTMLGTCVASLLLRNHEHTRESVAVLVALIAAVVVVEKTQMVWRWPPGIVLSQVTRAGAVLVVWMAVRPLLDRGRFERWSLASLVSCALFPTLIGGFMIPLVELAIFRGSNTAAAVNALAIVLACFALGIVIRCRSSRRRLMIFGLSLGLCAALVVSSAVRTARYGRTIDTTTADKSDDRPHIVLIVLDTMRADHLQRYGYSRNTMPFLEQWADDAFIAIKAVSTSGWTSPAHASIFSGRTVSLHGVHYVTDGEGYRTPPLDGIEWLPERLASEGYYTLAVSANEYALPEVDGFRRVLCPRRLAWPLDTLASRVDRRSPLLRRISERLRWKMTYADAKQITDITMRAVPKGDGLVFLFINLMDSHGPYNPPASALDALGVEPEHLFERYLDHAEIHQRWSSLPPGKTDTLVDLYDGEMRWIDQQLARLLPWVEKRFGQETIVIITSDHGEELGEDGRVGHEYGLSQSLVHVPLIIKGPGLPTGEFDDLVTLRNLYEFILTAARGKPDIGALTRQDAFGVVAERYPSANNTKWLGPAYGRPWVALFDGGYKALGPSAAGCALSDVGAPGFREKPIALDSDGAEGLRVRIDEYWEQCRDRRSEFMEFQAPTKEEIEQLKALGYVD